MELTVTAGGPTSADDAWVAYTTPSLWRRWAPHMPPVESSDGVIVAGSQGRFHVGPVTLGRFEVVDVDDAARTWSWRVTVLGLTTTGRHAVVSPATGGCRCSMTMALPPPLALVYRPLAWWALRRLARFSAHRPADP